jgi:hypothetical protein
LVLVNETGGRSLSKLAGMWYSSFPVDFKCQLAFLVGFFTYILAEPSADPSPVWSIQKTQKRRVQLIHVQHIVESQQLSNNNHAEDRGIVKQMYRNDCIGRYTWRRCSPRAQERPHSDTWTKRCGKARVIAFET